MIRHTREEEETGRRELLGATVVGRHAPLVAALAVTIGAGLLVAGLLTAGLAGVGLPLAGSFAFGLGYAGVAAVFAGIGAVAAQLTEASSTARGIGVGVAGVTFLLRMTGDSGGEATEWVAWLSPIGWFSRLRPFADEQWWVLVLWLGLSAALITTAALVASRRDVGAGALPPRPGACRCGTGIAQPARVGVASAAWLRDGLDDRAGGARGGLWGRRRQHPGHARGQSPTARDLRANGRCTRAD